MSNKTKPHLVGAHHVIKPVKIDTSKIPHSMAKGCSIKTNQEFDYTNKAVKPIIGFGIVDDNDNQ